MDNVNQPIVIDNGSGTLRAGFAGGENPKLFFTNFIGRPKYVPIMVGGLLNENFIGEDAEKHAGLLKLQYPIEHGIVRDWGQMEKVWKEMYKLLPAHNHAHPVLITDAPLNPRTNREKMTRVFFEEFTVPAFFVSIPAILSLYASGRTTGMVLDVGDGVSQSVPIVEGCAIPHAMYRADLAGRDITDYFTVLLRKGGINMHTTAEIEIVKKIKEKHCYLSLDISKDEIREKTEKTEYILPDGSPINLSSECFRAPEALFQPSLIGEEYLGVHEMIATTIAKTDIDLRQNLFSNIVLSGGTTMTTNFGQRLLASLRKIAPRESPIKLIAPKDRKTSVWCGGSVLASLSTFKQMWITRKEYEETGEGIVHRKTL